MVKNRNTLSDYDFDISQDDYSPSYSAKDSNRRSSERYSVNRKSSIHDRTKEILEKNKAIGKLSDYAENTDRMASYESTLADLMEGVTLSPLIQSPPKSPASAPQNTKHGYTTQSSFESMSESFDISEADLEVGTLASRRAKEKAVDRRARRQSLDQAPHSLPSRDLLAKKGSSSPEISQQHRKSSAYAGNGRGGGLQLSAALSSIHQSTADARNALGQLGENMAGYGSAERSDDEIYRMLDGTGGGSAMMSGRSSEAHADRDDLPDTARLSGRSEVSDVTQPDDEPARAAFGRQHLQDEEDDYSLDDFEEPAHQPAAPPAATTAAHTVVPAETKAASVAVLSHVDQIMQRWYNPDSEFLRASLAEHPVPTVEESVLVPDAADEVGRPVADVRDESAISFVLGDGANASELDNQRNVSLSAPVVQSLANEASASAVGDQPPVVEVAASPEAGEPQAVSMVASRTEGQDSLAAVRPDAEGLDVRTGTSEMPPCQHDVSLQLKPRERTVTSSSSAASATPPPASLETAVSHPNSAVSGSPDSTHSPHEHSASTGQQGYPAIGQGDSMRRQGHTAAQASDKDAGTEESLGEVQAAVRQGPRDEERTSGELLAGSLAAGLVKSYQIVAEASGGRDDDWRDAVLSGAQEPARFKLAPGTAARASKLSRMSPEERKSKVVSSRPATHAQTASADASKAAVLRLQQDNLALSRKFEKFEKGMMQLRASATAPSAARRVSSAAAVARGPDSRKKRLSSDGTVPTTETSRGRQLSGSRSVSQINIRPLSTQETPARGRREESQECLRASNDALLRVHAELDRLGGREEEVADREAAVAVREALVELREQHAEGRLAGATDRRVAREGVVSEIRERNEEVVRLRASERALAEEMGQLKAALLAHERGSLAVGETQMRQSLGLVGPSAIEMKRALGPSRLPKPAPRSHHPSGSGQVVGDPAEGESEGDCDGQNGATATATTGKASVRGMVSVNRAQYEALLQDHATQESLIAAYQRESEAATARAKQAEAESNAERAALYGEFAALKRENCRVRGLLGEATASELRDDMPLGDHAGSGASTVRQSVSAERLRADLELDKMVRGLKERVAEAEAAEGKREKALQASADRLLQENRELTEQLNTLFLKVRAPLQRLEGEVRAAEARRLQVEEENAGLRRKVDWYVCNQDLLDKHEARVAEMTRALTAVHREVSAQGPLTARLRRTFESAGLMSATNAGGGEDTNDISMDTTAMAGNPRAMSKADRGLLVEARRRIRDLEGTVADLREAIRRRKPDSVAALVSAAASSEKATDAQAAAETIVSLRQELSGLQSQHETRLRTLRQENDRMRVQYEKSLADLAQQQQQQTPKQKTRRPGGMCVATDDAEADSAGLQQIVDELRHELERTRTFYRGKIDQMELAYAAKVRALKRGDSGTAGGREAGADLPQGISKPSTGRVEGGWSAAAGSEDVVGGSAASQADLNAPRGVYEERINQLQRLLVESREELGRTKAELHVLKESTAVASQSPQGGFAPPLPPDSSRQVAAQVSEQQAAEVQRARDRQRDAEAALAAKEEFWSQCQRHLEERHSADISGLTQRWAAERDQLNGFLREESAKCDALRTELSNRAAQAHPPRSVDAISLLELKVSELDGRMRRREADFMRALDESLATARLERAKLLSLHQQEMREKEDQLGSVRRQLSETADAFTRYNKLHSCSPAAGGVEECKQELRSSTN